jgi:hypothetical protein
MLVFIFLKVQQIKQWINKTEQTQEFQELRTKDNPTLLHSVNLAHSPTYSLLNSVVYWCSHHYTHTLIHIATQRVELSAVHTRCPINPTLWYPHSLSATHNTLPSTLAVRYTQHSTVHTRCPLHTTLYRPHSCPLHTTLCRPHSLSATHNTLPSTLAVHYTQHSAVHTRCPLYAALCQAVHHTTVHLLLSAGLTLYNVYCTSWTYFSFPVSAGYP